MSWYPTSAEAVINESLPSDELGGFKIATPPDLAEADVPAATDLDTWQWEQYQLESDIATKLGLTVGGGGDLARKSRVLVAEFSRSKSFMSPAGQCRYGVAARLVVKVSKFDAGANMTLPFIAAEAQFNRLEASAALRVEGYVGPDASKQFPNFGAFNVESYVKLMESLSALKDTIGSDIENVRPVRLWAWAESTGGATTVDDRLTHAVGTMWALSKIADGSPMVEAIANYQDTDDEVAQAAIRETYGYLLPGDEVSAQARARANDLLDGYKAKAGWFSR